MPDGKHPGFIDFEFLRLIEAHSARPWKGTVFRHMFEDFAPDRENTTGGRWNPPGCAALYAALSREVALAEGDFYLLSFPSRYRRKRTIYRISVELSSVIDLSSVEALRPLGITDEILRSNDHFPCRRIGGAVEGLGRDGLLVPSARALGINLVIYTARTGSRYEFRVLDAEVLDPGE